jgi:hypothetical protein
MNTNKLTRISLTLNVGLAMLCVAIAFRRSGSPAAIPLAQTSIQPLTETRPASLTTKNNSVSVEPRNWIVTLRSEGIPEKVLAQLALADFDDLWQGRQSKAQEEYNRGDMDADGLAALARQHDIEQENDLRARLGETAFREWDAARLFQQFNLDHAALTASETNSLYELAVNLRARLRDLEKARGENEMDQAAFNAEQTKAQADFETHVRALLGDERYGALHGTDPAVGELRRNLHGLNLDDQQFATLLQAQQQWDTARAHLEQQQVETGGTHLQPQIDALTQQRDQTFASILGTNGLALFEKQQDSRYLELQKNAAQWGIDSSKLDYIYHTIQAYEKATTDYDRKLRDLEARGMKVDTDLYQQPLRNYARDMAQCLRTNLGEAQYQAVSQNRILPFASP